MEKELSLALSLSAMSAILCAPSSSAAEASPGDGETVVHAILVGGIEPGNALVVQVVLRLQVHPYLGLFFCI